MSRTMRQTRKNGIVKDKDFNDVMPHVPTNWRIQENRKLRRKDKHVSHQQCDDVPRKDYDRGYSTW